ncbi:MAG: PD40 domain-containing protein [Anaerolineae bacterium]|nr:PD40 domain-containing protein [Anaerolineae bacterium]
MRTKAACRILQALLALSMFGWTMACSPTAREVVPTGTTILVTSTPITPPDTQPVPTALLTNTSPVTVIVSAEISLTKPIATFTPMPMAQPSAVGSETPLPSCERSIVFAARLRQTQSLTVVNACSEETVYLTNDKGRDEWPKWAPSGQYIAFLSDRAERGGDYLDLWLISTTTGELTQLTYGARIWPYARAFVWSPNGREILYSSTAENGIEFNPRIVNLEDGSDRLLPGCFREPFSWSPDGTRIALEACLELSEKPPEGYENDMRFPGNLVIIQPDGNLLAGRSDVDGYRLANSNGWDWSPDGQLLAVAFFSSLAGGGGDVELVAIQGGNLITLSRLRDLMPSMEYKSVQSLAWSPDGDEIAFVVVEPPVHDRPYWGQVYVVDSNLTTSRALTPDGMFCDGVQWSPDGAQLVFTCDEGEPYASVWLVNADGSNLHAITESAKDLRGPQWKRIAP